MEKVRHDDRRGFAHAVLCVMTDVLEALDAGTGARRCFCEQVASLFGCASCAHAWYDAGFEAWSVCLWREAAEGRRTVTLSEAEDLTGPLGDWWSWSSCRSVVHDWLAAPHLAEVPLRNGVATRGLVVLGRASAFGHEDARRMTSSRRHLAAVERIMVRVEEPALARRGPATLTTRETEVLELLGRGLLARSIAQRLSVSERTVHKHLGNVYRKLDAHDRLIAVQRARSLGLLGPAPAEVAALQPA